MMETCLRGFDSYKVMFIFLSWLFLLNEQAQADSIEVKNSRTLAVTHLAAQRVPVGIREDYKPCIAKLSDGQLILTAFHSSQNGGVPQEYVFLHRSHDGGETWSERERLDLYGREPYFSLVADGSLLVTTHLLKRARGNDEGYVQSFLYRSIDAGKSWQPNRIRWQDIPGAREKAWIHTSRNALQLHDGTILVGVSAKGGPDVLWKSQDGGESWAAQSCAFEGVDPSKLWWPFWAETFLWQTPSGDLIGLWRVDQKTFPMSSGDVSKATTDQHERLIVFRSTDGGAHWTREKELGSVEGEMYPSILRLQDGRLLLTYTVRAAVASHQVPLGVRAVLGVESDDGFRFDFENDIIMLDTKTPQQEGMHSGGGFGPTVQLDDGSLVTAYSYRSEDTKHQVEVVRWRLP
ncbi:MAG: glycoside hydrolase [Pirellulaceae bacterium]|nr:glycoside hydrolase [Pirellulaceae bacterium]